MPGTTRRTIGKIVTISAGLTLNGCFGVAVVLSKWASVVFNSWTDNGTDLACPLIFETTRGVVLRAWASLLHDRARIASGPEGWYTDIEVWNVTVVVSEIFRQPR